MVEVEEHSVMEIGGPREEYGLKHQTEFIAHTGQEHYLPISSEWLNIHPYEDSDGDEPVEEETLKTCEEFPTQLGCFPKKEKPVEYADIRPEPVELYKTGIFWMKKRGIDTDRGSVVNYKKGADGFYYTILNLDYISYDYDYFNKKYIYSYKVDFSNKGGKRWSYEWDDDAMKNPKFTWIEPEWENEKMKVVITEETTDKDLEKIPPNPVASGSNKGTNFCADYPTHPSCQDTKGKQKPDETEQEAINRLALEARKVQPGIPQDSGMTQKEWDRTIKWAQENDIHYSDFAVVQHDRPGHTIAVDKWGGVIAKMLLWFSKNVKIAEGIKEIKQGFFDPLKAIRAETGSIEMMDFARIIGSKPSRISKVFKKNQFFEFVDEVFGDQTQAFNTAVNEIVIEPEDAPVAVLKKTYLNSENPLSPTEIKDLDVNIGDYNKIAKRLNTRKGIAVEAENIADTTKLRILKQKIIDKLGVKAGQDYIDKLDTDALVSTPKVTPDEQLAKDSLEAVSMKIPYNNDIASSVKMNKESWDNLSRGEQNIRLSNRGLKYHDKSGEIKNMFKESRIRDFRPEDAPIRYDPLLRKLSNGKIKRSVWNTLNRAEQEALLEESGLEITGLIPTIGTPPGRAPGKGMEINWGGEGTDGTLPGINKKETVIEKEKWKEPGDEINNVDDAHRAQMYEDAHAKPWERPGDSINTAADRTAYNAYNAKYEGTLAFNELKWADYPGLNVKNINPGDILIDRASGEFRKVVNRVEGDTIYFTDRTSYTAKDSGQEKFRVKGKGTDVVVTEAENTFKLSEADWTTDVFIKPIGTKLGVFEGKDIIVGEVEAGPDKFVYGKIEKDLHYYDPSKEQGWIRTNKNEMVFNKDAGGEAKPYEVPDAALVEGQGSGFGSKLLEEMKGFRRPGAARTLVPFKTEADMTELHDFKMYNEKFGAAMEGLEEESSSALKQLVTKWGRELMESNPAMTDGEFASNIYRRFLTEGESSFSGDIANSFGGSQNMLKWLDRERAANGPNMEWFSKFTNRMGEAKNEATVYLKAFGHVNKGVASSKETFATSGEALSVLQRVGRFARKFFSERGAAKVAGTSEGVELTGMGDSKSLLEEVGALSNALEEVEVGLAAKFAKALTTAGKFAKAIAPAVLGAALGVDVVFKLYHLGLQYAEPCGQHHAEKSGCFYDKGNKQYMRTNYGEMAEDLSDIWGTVAGIGLMLEGYGPAGIVAGILTMISGGIIEFATQRNLNDYEFVTNEDLVARVDNCGIFWNVFFGICGAINNENLSQWAQRNETSQDKTENTISPARVDLGWKYIDMGWLDMPEGMDIIDNNNNVVGKSGLSPEQRMKILMDPRSNFPYDYQYNKKTDDGLPMKPDDNDKLMYDRIGKPWRALYHELSPWLIPILPDGSVNPYIGAEFEQDWEWVDNPSAETMTSNGMIYNKGKRKSAQSTGFWQIRGVETKTKIDNLSKDRSYIEAYGGGYSKNQILRDKYLSYHQSKTATERRGQGLTFFKGHIFLGSSDDWTNSENIPNVARDMFNTGEDLAWIQLNFSLPYQLNNNTSSSDYTSNNALIAEVEEELRLFELNSANVVSQAVKERMRAELMKKSGIETKFGKDVPEYEHKKLIGMDLSPGYNQKGPEFYLWWNDQNDAYYWAQNQAMADKVAGADFNLNKVNDESIQDYGYYFKTSRAYYDDVNLARIKKKQHIPYTPTVQRDWLKYADTTYQSKWGDEDFFETQAETAFFHYDKDLYDSPFGLEINPASLGIIPTSIKVLENNIKGWEQQLADAGTSWDETQQYKGQGLGASILVGQTYALINAKKELAEAYDKYHIADKFRIDAPDEYKTYHFAVGEVNGTDNIGGGTYIVRQRPGFLEIWDEYKKEWVKSSVNDYMWDTLKHTNKKPGDLKPEYREAAGEGYPILYKKPDQNNLLFGETGKMLLRWLYIDRAWKESKIPINEWDMNKQVKKTNRIPIDGIFPGNFLEDANIGEHLIRGSFRWMEKHPGWKSGDTVDRQTGKPL